MELEESEREGRQFLGKRICKFVSSEIDMQNVQFFVKTISREINSYRAQFFVKF